MTVRRREDVRELVEQALLDGVDAEVVDYELAWRPGREILSVHGRLADESAPPCSMLPCSRVPQSKRTSPCLPRSPSSTPPEGS